MKASELVLADDGSLYHIHLTGKELADDVFLVGDPDRVNMFKELFDSVEFESQNREIHAITGLYRNHRFTVLSTGMGCDNIDIILTELDAAANIVTERGIVDETCSANRHLNLVRIGTSGSLHSEIPCGSLVASAYAIGIDGLLNFYEHDDDCFDEPLLQHFLQHMNYPARLARPYAVSASQELLKKVAFDMTQGITATAPGFYAPQGRHIRIAPSFANLNEKLSTFEWKGIKATNLEMETSGIYGLSALLGHNALTVCLIIANRADGTFISDHQTPMRETIIKIMNRLS